MEETPALVTLRYLRVTYTGTIGVEIETEDEDPRKVMVRRAKEHRELRT